MWSTAVSVGAMLSPPLEKQSAVLPDEVPSDGYILLFPIKKGGIFFSWEIKIVAAVFQLLLCIRNFT